MSAQSAGDGSLDWGQVGAIVVSVFTGALGAIGARRGLQKPDPPKQNDPPAATATVQSDDVRAVDGLKTLVVALQTDNERLWERNRDWEARYLEIEARLSSAEKAIAELRSERARLRKMLVEAGVDPG